MLSLPQRIQLHVCVSQRGQKTLPRDYQNNGLYNIDGNGAYPPAISPGLVGISHDSADSGKFCVPTLRNVELSAPYMHDGSIDTLEEVIDHYAAGGRVIGSGENAGAGRANPRKSSFVRGFSLRERERTSLVEFLRSLTDERFVSDARVSNPWVE